MCLDETQRHAGFRCDPAHSQLDGYEERLFLLEERRERNKKTLFYNLGTSLAHWGRTPGRFLRFLTPGPGSQLASLDLLGATVNSLP